MIRRHSLPFTCFLFLTISIAHAEQQWVEVTSPHFSVLTDAGEKRGRDVALRFEQMRTAFGVLFQKMNVNTAVKLQIIAYRNGKELRQVAPLYEGKPISLAGFFLGGGSHGMPNNGEDREYIALDLSAENNWGTVFHEYAHLLINSNFPPTPLWFDEGFAEYCSSLKVDKKEIAIGLPRPDLPVILSENRWLNLLDLFRVGHDSKIYNRDDRRSVFYAQSWITVHYFMSKGVATMKQVGTYNRLTRDPHIAVPDAIRQAFGLEPEQLQKAIETYFKTSNVLYFKAPAPPGIDDIAVQSRTVDDTESKTIFADLDFHTRDYRARGLAAFEEILTRQPDNPIANRALGYAALQKRDWEKAGEHFQRAVTQATKDPQVHYFLALLMSRKSMSSGRAPDDLETMKKELNTAISLDPNFADAYSLLGVALSYDPKHKEEAVNALRKAMALNPRNEGYALNLANIYIRSQEVDQALSTLTPLKESQDPQIAAAAREQLEQIESYKGYLADRKKAHADIETAQAKADEEKADDEQEPDQLEKPAEIKRPEDVKTVAVPYKPEPILFLKGMLVSVDCSQSPAATLTISSSGKKWKMVAPDARKLVVMGADSLSCSWTNKKVAINYRKTGENEGRLATLELE